jgi:cobaltochelatase CobS
MTQIRDLFGMPNIPESAVVDVRPRVAGLPDGVYPTINPHYYFHPVMLKKMIRYFFYKTARRNILLIGDAGVGKSSLIEQVAARLGWPVFSIACSGRIRLQHFVGTFSLVNGQTKWQDGPLIKAMKYGGIFLADEITRLDHSEQMALAKVLDSGATLTIPDTGEVVVAHEGFRFVATGNSGGFGDESGAYNGERVSSVAFLDRFQKFHMDYMPEEDEFKLLQRTTATTDPKNGLEDSILKSMVKLANDVRGQFVSRGGDMRTVMSTRSLCVWALEAIGYKGISKLPLEEALHDTVLNGCPDNDKKVILELWNKWIHEAA